jgi:Xaa-Pro aminopeptidase
VSRDLPPLQLTVVYSYRFHQHNDFLYLTGFQEADAVLILETNDSIKLPDHKAILYTTPRNPYKEKWEGPLMGPDDAVDFLGVDEAYSLNLFAEHLEERYYHNNVYVHVASNSMYLQ